MNRSIKTAIILFCLLEAGIGAYAAYRIIARSNALGVTKIGNETENPLSPLRFYYEPVSNTTETEKTRWTPGTVTFRYNNDHMNAREDYPVDKPSGTFRIVALGDSFTFGSHITTGGAWPEQLQDMLRARKPEGCAGYEVLNLGLQAFDIQNEVERFRITGANYRPDLVIWLLVPNDFTDVRELTQPRVIELYNEASRSGKLAAPDDWSPATLQAMAELGKKYSFAQLARMQDGFVTTFKSMYTGPLILSTFPYLEPKNKEQMKKWAVSPWQYFDGLPDTEADASVRFADGHPNLLGHRKIADAYYNYLVTHGVISCGK